MISLSEMAKGAAERGGGAAVIVVDRDGIELIMPVSVEALLDPPMAKEFGGRLNTFYRELRKERGL